MFYLRLTLEQLARLHGRTDCSYDFELVAPEIRDWLTLNAPPVRELRTFYANSAARRRDPHSVALTARGLSRSRPATSPAVESC